MSDAPDDVDDADDPHDSHQEDPLGELDAEVEGTPEDPFTEMDVEGIADDALWSQLSDGDDTVEVVEGKVVVPKRKYCERCEYFTEPPEVACEHPGTEIHELVDMNHFRVENCPVVARRRGIEAGSDE